MNSYVDYTAKVSKKFKPEEHILDAKTFSPMQQVMSDLPPAVPPRRHGRKKRKTLERQNDIARSGFDPVTDEVDDEERLELFEKVSQFYNQVESKLSPHDSY